MRIILALLLLAASAHATLSVNPIPLSPYSLYLETVFFDLDLSATPTVKETVSGEWPSGTFTLSLEIKRTPGLAIATMETRWLDGWTSTATFSNSFSWGFIRALTAPGNDGNFTQPSRTDDGMTFSLRGRYNGTLYPYPEQIADGEFVFQMQRIAAASAIVPEPCSTLLCLFGAVGAMALRRATA